MSLSDALAALDNNAMRILAGGTDYYPALNDGTPHQHLLAVHQIAGLERIEQVDNHWRIGAAVTWTDLIQADLPTCFNALKLAAKEIGSVQIQNTATLVGNICNASPAADGVPALLVLDTKVELQSVSGTRVLPLAEFITGVRSTSLDKNELLTALLIPEAVSDDKTDFVKLGARTYLVISIVMCAIRLRVDKANVITDVAIAVGACSAVASRLTALEQSLVGCACDVESLQQLVNDKHLEPLSPIDDVRATAAYRIDATKVLLQRQLLAFAWQAPTGVDA